MQSPVSNFMCGARIRRAGACPAMHPVVRHWGSDGQGPPKTAHVTRHGPGTTKRLNPRGPRAVWAENFCCCCSLPVKFINQATICCCFVAAHLDISTGLLRRAQCRLEIIICKTVHKTTIHSTSTRGSSVGLQVPRFCARFSHVPF